VVNGERGDVVEHALSEHLSDADLAFLAASAATGDTDGGRRVGVGELRAEPRLIAGLISDGRAFDALFGPRASGEALLHVSPHLVFALTVQRGLSDLQHAASVEEWVGPGRRVPLLGTGQLQSFLADPVRRLFLAELLASYSHVTSGSVWSRTRTGWRRRRFSELDPIRLAGLLDVVGEAERPGIYRRLGDLCLFLSGVFPDHTATHGFGPVSEARLFRAASLTRRPGSGDGGGGASQPPSGRRDLDLGTVGLLEQLGARWYRLACETAAPRGSGRPLTGTMAAVADLADRFREARRVLNFLTDRYLFPLRQTWFGGP
jgi:hypothetical protein